MKNKSYALLLVVIFYSCSSTSELTTINDIKLMIEQQFNDTLFAHAHWGVQIESLENGEIWYQKNSNRMFMPASNEKILTAAAALLYLGPEFKYQTDIYFTGDILDSVLTGDLIIRSNGDPTFYTRFYEDPAEQFNIWADSLLKLGIKKIEGDIIGDDNAFDDEGLGMGWAHDGLDVWYSAESGALQFNENYLDIEIIAPSNLYDTIKIIPNIKSDYYRIINEINLVDTGRSAIRVNRPFNQNEIYISGNLVVGNDTIRRSPSLHNPTLFYANVFKEVLEANYITISGTALDCDNITSWDIDELNSKLLITHYSPPLKDILKVLMKRSQNLYAETLVKTIGWKESGIGSFSSGKNVVERLLTDFGIDIDTYEYNDGSGLSRYNFVSPSQIIKVLKGMRGSDYWDLWKEIFPIAGVDGTLRNRMRGNKAEGNVIAKTGTISNVRGLSGYVTTSDNEEIVFSFLINGHLRNSWETDLVTDKVLEMISEYPFGNINISKK